MSRVDYINHVEGRFLYCAGKPRVRNKEIQKEINDKRVHMTICLLGKIDFETYKNILEDIKKLLPIQLRLTGEKMFGPKNDVPVMVGHLTKRGDYGDSFENFGADYGIPPSWMVAKHLERTENISTKKAMERAEAMPREESRKYWNGQNIHIKTKTEKIHRYFMENEENRIVDIEGVFLQEVGKKGDPIYYCEIQTLKPKAN